MHKDKELLSTVGIACQVADSKIFVCVCDLGQLLQLQCSLGQNLDTKQFRK